MRASGVKNATNNNDYFNYASGVGRTTEEIAGASSKEGFTDMKLQLNGHDRFSKRKASYFRTCQPIQAADVHFGAGTRNQVPIDARCQSYMPPMF